MSKDMRPHTKKVNIDTSVTNSDKIALLLPGIDNNYTLLSKPDLLKPDNKSLK